MIKNLILSPLPRLRSGIHVFCVFKIKEKFDGSQICSLRCLGRGNGSDRSMRKMKFFCGLHVKSGEVV
jgi:hypothetical protein